NGFAKGLAVGQSVSQSHVIGYVGATGLATGPHLDFRMLRDGRPVDPLTVEMPPAEPIDNDAIIDFMDMSDKLKASLDSLLNN
ncbi:MAG: M23 family metallopeptidase, partial [Bacteroidales bacterium]|nr:M23 family metallopeptidase [Bacteroidales bacterium]